MTDKMRRDPLDQQGSATARPTPGSVDRTRDLLAGRVGDWDFHAEGALDLAAELYVALRQQMHAKSSALRGPRRPKYFREMLLAAHPITLEDIARLVIQAPRETAPFVRRLSAALEQVLGEQRSVAPALEITEAVARASESSAGAGAAVLRAGRDGHVDDAENADCDAKIAAARQHLAELEAAKEAKRPSATGTILQHARPGGRR